MSWLPEDVTPPVDAALLYAEHGLRPVAVWWVRPDGSCACGKAGCDNEGKHPIGRAWQRAASSDEATVRTAWRGRSSANVGLAMGGAARLVAIDLDGAAGFASWAALEAEHGAAPETLTSRSGRTDGGEHRLFTVPASLDWRRVKNRTAVWPGLDVRADGGQIVVAPSRHKSGAQYTWSRRVPIAPMPQWLYDVITGPSANASKPVTKEDTAPRQGGQAPSGSSYFDAVLRNACREIASASQGGRNDTLFRKAATVFEYCIGMRLDRSGPSADLEAAGRECGLTAGEVRKALESAWDTVKGGQGKVPPARPLRVVAGGLASGNGAQPDAAVQAVRERLITNGEGRIKATLTNVAILLSAHPAWVGVLGYDEFRSEVAKCKPAPASAALGPRVDPAGPWQDVDSLRAASWLETEIGIEAKRGMVEEAVDLVAREHAFHPVRDYLRGLAWDRTPRLDAWLVTYAGAADNDYTRGVGARWLISAVARTFEPGCQVDCVLVLEGPQGIRKSTLLRTLAGRDWFSELGTVGDKDTLQGLRGKLVLEMAELAAMKGRSREKVKDFLTTHVDTYRPSYGRRAVDVPRQCVFAATTNDQHYLDDPTGHRRFWPVKVSSADVAAVARDRDQLWAEAVHRYRAGEAWHVDTEELRVLCEAEQAEREPGDSWDEELRAWLERPVVLERTVHGVEARMVDVSKGVQLKDALRGILGPDATKAPRSVEMRLAECFRRLGYERTTIPVGRARPRVWRVARPKAINLIADPPMSQNFPRAVETPSSSSQPPSLSGVSQKVDQVDQVDQELQNKGAQTDPPLASDPPKVDPIADSGTRRPPTDALDLPDSFFEGGPLAPGVDHAATHTDDAADPCTCMAGPGDEHTSWCTSSAQGAAE